MYVSKLPPEVSSWLPLLTLINLNYCKTHRHTHKGQIIPNLQSKRKIKSSIMFTKMQGALTLSFRHFSYGGKISLQKHSTPRPIIFIF